jgi:hypothetical protein
MKTLLRGAHSRVAVPLRVFGLLAGGSRRHLLFQPEALCVDTHVLNKLADRDAAMHWPSTGDQIEVKAPFLL